MSPIHQLESTSTRANATKKSNLKVLHTRRANFSSNLLPLEAIEIYERAIGTFVKGGRFHLAATHEKEIAEIYETQLHDYQAAIKYYLQAADRFMIDDSTAIAQGCMSKAAQLAADSEAYEKAAELFEQLAEGSVNDQLRKYAVKDYLFRGALCRLCLGDSVSAKRAIERYATLDPSFGASKEFSLLNEITAVIETGDVDEYTELITKWDRTNAMDEWKTKVFLKIKKSIEAEPSLT
jgi:alpha-soluble NSF attachment protein